MLLIVLAALSMSVVPAAPLGATTMSDAPSPCRVVNFATESLADAQNAVIACADWLMRTEFKRTSNLQCVPFAEKLWKLVTPPELSVKGRFESCAGRRFTQLRNQGRSVFAQPPSGEPGLPYLVWWSDKKVAGGCGHVAVYIGGGKFLDNSYFKRNRGKPWNVLGTWPSRYVVPTGYTTIGYWNN